MAKPFANRLEPCVYRHRRGLCHGICKYAPLKHKNPSPVIILVMPQLTLRVYRHTPGEDRLPHYDMHTVNVVEHASVLDALFSVQATTALDLAFRFSCRVGMCGSCALLVNGRERLACSTTVAPLGPTVRL